MTCPACEARPATYTVAVGQLVLQLCYHCMLRISIIPTTSDRKAP